MACWPERQQRQRSEFPTPKREKIATPISVNSGYEMFRLARSLASRHEVETRHELTNDGLPSRAAIQSSLQPLALSAWHPPRHPKIRPWLQILSFITALPYGMHSNPILDGRKSLKLAHPSADPKIGFVNTDESPPDPHIRQHSKCA